MLYAGESTGADTFSLALTGSHTDVTFSNCTFSVASAAVFGQAKCMFDGCTFFNSSASAVYVSTASSTIRNCEFANCALAITAAARAHIKCEDTSMTGCSCTAIQVIAASSFAAERLLVEHCASSAVHVQHVDSTACLTSCQLGSCGGDVVQVGLGASAGIFKSSFVGGNPDPFRVGSKANKLTRKPCGLELSRAGTHVKAEECTFTSFAASSVLVGDHADLSLTECEFSHNLGGITMSDGTCSASVRKCVFGDTMQGVQNYQLISNVEVRDCALADGTKLGDQIPPPKATAAQ